MEQTLLIIIIGILLLSNIALIFGFFWLFNKFVNNKKIPIEKSTSESVVPKKSQIPDAFLDNNKMQKIETLTGNLLQGDYCVDHPTEVSAGQCAISSNNYCKECLKSFQNIKIGKKFMNLFLAQDWVDFYIIPKKDVYEEIDVNYLNLKQQLWMEDKIPVIIQNHFKINIQNDQIESYLVFKSRKNDADSLKKRFETLHFQ